MALEGTLDVLRLPEVLQMVSMQQKTGILTVQGENDIVAVSFLTGQVVAADALNQTVEEGLGQVLASEGLVRPEDFGRAAAEHAAGGERLVDLLVARGLLDRSQVLGALRQQTYRLLLQVLRWERGEFKFYTGEEVAFEDGFLPISVEELLIRSVEDLGGEGGLEEDDRPRIDAAYQRVPGTTQIKIFGEDGEGPLEDAAALWLSPPEKKLLQRLDGETPAGAVGRAVGLDDYQVLYALYRLLQAGLVERVFTAQPELPAVVERVPSVPPTVVEPYEDEPPLDEPEPGDRSSPRVPARQRERLMPWITPIAARALAIGAAAMLIVAVVDRPRRLLMPFPWQESDRWAFAETQLRTSFAAIANAAGAFFLVEGRFPADLAELAAHGVAPARLAVDPEGDPIALSSEVLGYRLEPIKNGEPVVELGFTATAAGDILLDAEVVAPPAGSDQPPLVLLD